MAGGTYLMPRPKSKPKVQTPRPKKTQMDYVMPESNMPDPDSIVARIPFTSPTGKKFMIIRTNELDPYEEKAKKPRKRSGERAVKKD